MHSNKRPAQNLHELHGGDDAFHRLTLNSQLNVTVIATTARGTTAALNEARRLTQDLDARITLLKMEVAPHRFPLGKSAVSLHAATKRHCSIVLQSSAREEGASVRTCVCRDPGFTWHRIFRRRALILIGGRRHWWLSREEKLEKVLRGMGHHVIFVELGGKANSTRQSRSPAAFGDRTSQSRKKVGTPESLLGSEALRRNDAGDWGIMRRTSPSVVRRRGGKDNTNTKS